jgi:putative Holliday junction resolvase
MVFQYLTFGVVSRTLAIDFGLKRTGLAISDPLDMIANGLDTVETKELLDRLEVIDENTEFQSIVVGEPKRMNGEHSDVERNIQLFIAALKSKFPDKIVHRFDERFTSKMAAQTMIQSGIGRSKRKEKGIVDKISATLILQEFLNSQKT